MALVVLAQIRGVFAERRTRWFLALEVAMAGITLGWWLRGQAVGVVINGAALVALAAGWRLRRPT